jgi:hypothetical protein
MQLIGTRSLTQHGKAWLGNSNHPRILHVFDRACNLINERNEVLSVVTQEIGNGPFNLVVEEIVLFSNDLNVETPVSISNDQLILGAFRIDTAAADLWDPRPDWEQLHRDREYIADRLNKIPVPDLQLPNPLISTLTFSLAKADIFSAKNTAEKLAGLGIGLTPSGDDFMMGALYATWIIHPSNVARTLAAEIANITAPLTTSLSAAWLRSAGRGETGIWWHEYFAALISSDPVRIQSKVDDILVIGATSGADALAGFMSTFVAYTELEKKHVISKFIR